MNETHFAIRTVRKGKVKIGGKVFRPSEQHLAYDGRLDGLRMGFNRYENFGGGGYQSIVQLWGTEDRYLRLPDGEGPGPEVVDGTLPWVWWGTEEVG